MIADMLTVSKLSLTSTLCVVFLAYVVFQRWLSPLAKFPGPWAAALSKYWIVDHTIKGQLHRELIQLHARHGPVVRIAPNELSVADLDAIRQIYGAKPRGPEMIAVVLTLNIIRSWI